MSYPSLTSVKLKDTLSASGATWLVANLHRSDEQHVRAITH